MSLLSQEEFESLTDVGQESFRPDGAGYEAMDEANAAYSIALIRIAELESELALAGKINEQLFEARK